MSRPRRRILNLHHHQRGVVQFIMLVMILFLFALGGLIFNTGQVVSRKMRTQTAADAAAYSAATLLSRSTNEIMGGDILIYRCIAADVLSKAPIIAANSMRKNLNAWEAAAEAMEILQPELAAEAELIKVEVRRERVMVIDFLAETAPAVAANVDQRYLRHVREIFEFQKDVYRQTPEVIAAQVENLRRYFDDGGLQIAIGQLHGSQVEHGALEDADQTQVDNSKIYPPVRRAGIADAATVLAPSVMSRVREDRRYWSNRLSNLILARGTTCWEDATDGVAEAEIALAAALRMFFVLRGSSSNQEDRVNFYSVIVLAKGQGTGSRAFLPGAFGAGANWHDVVLASSQAETHNPVPQGFWANLAESANWDVLVYAHWSWQPRLVLARALPKTLEDDTDRTIPRFKEWLQLVNIEKGNLPDDPSLIVH